jgi:MFS family permease
MSTPERNDAEATYRRDKWRAPFQGILEAGWQAFPLLIAIRYFEAPESVKAFIAGAGPIGFLLTPLTLFLAARLAARPSYACAVVFAMSAALILGAILASTLLTFTLCIIASQMAMVQHGPLMVQVYTMNYAPHERGRRVTTPLMLTAAFSVGFAWLGGEILDLDLLNYKYLFGSMALCALVCALAVRGVPSAPLSTEHVGNPWQSLSLIWKDRLFGFILSAWMLLGLGNLITIPIRVEYLANPAYGINANNATIALLLVVVPAMARLLSTKFWGRRFDQVHFVTTRNRLNFCFFLSIALFFFTTHFWLLALAMTFQGIAMGGGKIFWGLWVTKIAPPEKASAYMSIHMALTGFRGTLAPFLGYWILASSSPALVAWVGLALIAAAMLLFQTLYGHHRLTT